ncbi:hypothetical protein BH11PAT4_BH11PAT4_0230 [soil metagenome]
MNKYAISTGLRLAGFFALATTAILLGLNYVVTAQTDTQFANTIQVYQLEQRLEDGQLVPVAGVIRTGGTAADPREGGPREFFKRQFQGVLFWVTMVGIFISMTLGYLLAYLFVSRPLQRLRTAVEKLKKRELHPELDPTGVKEFDELIEDFNGLAGELGRVELLRQNLISDTSHELKTPLSALKLQLEGIKDGVVPMDATRAGVLLDQVDRLSDLTERLQDYARLRSRAATLQKKTVSMAKVVTAVLAEHEVALKKAGIVVEQVVDEKLTYQADRLLLTQLVSNLASNAIAHAGATNLVITATTEQFSVRDNGKGVPKEVLGDLFERFFRVQQSRHRSEGGLGLGLAIVQEITHAHGWKVWAENANPGLVFVVEVNSGTE